MALTAHGLGSVVLKEMKKLDVDIGLDVENSSPLTPKVVVVVVSWVRVGATASLAAYGPSGLFPGDLESVATEKSISPLLPFTYADPHPDALMPSPVVCMVPSCLAVDETLRIGSRPGSTTTATTAQVLKNGFVARLLGSNPSTRPNATLDHENNPSSHTKSTVSCLKRSWRCQACVMRLGIRYYPPAEGVLGHPMACRRLSCRRARCRRQQAWVGTSKAPNGIPDPDHHPGCFIPDPLKRPGAGTKAGLTCCQC